MFSDPFSLVGVVVDILFLVGGASGWSVPMVVATVVGGGGNGRLWKKDGMVCVEGVIAPFCFPFFWSRIRMIGVNEHVSCR